MENIQNATHRENKNENILSLSATCQMIIKEFNSANVKLKLEQRSRENLLEKIVEKFFIFEENYKEINPIISMNLKRDIQRQITKKTKKKRMASNFISKVAEARKQQKDILKAVNEKNFSLEICIQ